MTATNNNYDYILSNLQQVKSSIKQICSSCNRNPDDIIIEAVTKTISPDIINFAVQNGITVIGENKVQELNSKISELSTEHCAVHLIGHLQTNKIKDVIAKVTMIESVDSIHLADEINKKAKTINKCCDVLIQVNIGKDLDKYGFFKEQTEQALVSISKYSNISVKGLMTILPICKNQEQKLQLFDDMHHLFIDIAAKKIDNIFMDYLSMGMTNDYKEAIQCGSNIIRIGTALFGTRNYNGGY